MKRSKHVGLLVATASVITLAGCYEEDPAPKEIAKAATPPAISQPAAVKTADAHDAKVFTSMEDCLADVSTADKAAADAGRLQCVADWEKAKAEHEKTAPKFATLAECQAEFGPEGCGAAPQSGGTTVVNNGGDGGWFMPFMMGYMISNAMSPSYPVYHNTGSGYRVGSSAPDSARQRLSRSASYPAPSKARNAVTRSSTGTAATTRAVTPPKSTMSTSTRSRSSGFGASRSSGGSFGG